TEEKTELKLVLDQALVEKLDKIKGLLSHKNPHMSDRELIHELADRVLSQIDPAIKGGKRAGAKASSANQVAENVSARSAMALSANALSASKSPDHVSQSLQVLPKKSPPAPAVNERNAASKIILKGPSPVKRITRHIPNPIRREVWNRDRGCCTYQDLK